MFSISQNHVLFQFQIVKSCSCPIPLILAFSHKIWQTFANISLKITKNRENCHSVISRFLQMVRSEIIFTLDSRKFCSRPITNYNVYTDTFDRKSVSKLNFLTCQSLKAWKFWICHKFLVWLHYSWNCDLAFHGGEKLTHYQLKPLKNTKKNINHNFCDNRTMGFVKFCLVL